MQGRIDLTKYALFFPSRGLAREFEIRLVPTGADAGGGGGGSELTPQRSITGRDLLAPQCLAADNAEGFAQWKEALSKICAVQEDDQASLERLTISATDDGWESIKVEPMTIQTPEDGRLSVSGEGQGVGLEDFDQLSVLGKGGFGKVRYASCASCRRRAAQWIAAAVGGRAAGLTPLGVGTAVSCTHHM
eukprot:SAG25_NODE_2007_length_2035_cov_1.172521_2_plen_190_part_00